MQRNDPSEYLLGSADAEIERLAYQHEVWSDETSRMLRLAGIGIGDCVIDLGSGPGLMSLELAQRVTSDGRVISIEPSARFATMLHTMASDSARSHIEVIEADALSSGLETAVADHVVARWLFCFLEDPAAVLTECHRWLRPGGKLLIFDYFNYLAANVFPEQSEISALFQAYLDSVEAHGGSYQIGNRLPTLLHQHGFRIEHVDPVNRIARPGDAVWRWVELFNAVFVPKLVEQGIWSNTQRSDFEAAWERVAASPDSLLFSPPMLTLVASRQP